MTKPTLLEKLPANGFGIGMVEGWRGEVMVAMHTDAQGEPHARASARSFLAELAGAGTRHHRQHRAGFSAHQ